MLTIIVDVVLVVGIVAMRFIKLIQEMPIYEKGL